ncbi:hypothetical protein SAMD00019534_039550, partial [Acytostelium subglobosum LB1]|uniref:hypothetical protein n=1 Tax=Acytostelium subglobosum LB1 TaxID=1410327 RepID=UPI00064511CB
TIIRNILRYCIFSFAMLLRRLFPAHLALERLDIPVMYLDNPVKLVQISDIHYDEYPIRIHDEFMDKVIKTVNAQDPDIIVITGDLVQFKPEPIHELLKKHLSKLSARHGVYCILGNHDYKTDHGPETIVGALKDSNITMLVNETVYPMGKGQGKLQLVGLGDYSRKRANFRLDCVAADLAMKNTARVVLSHNPDSARELEPYDIDLVLSGHTHGGQICFPNGSPIIPVLDNIFLLLPRALLAGISYPRKVVKNWKWCRGHHILNGAQLEPPKNPQRPMHLYVNRGLATHPPMRLFCDPEITVVDLIPKQ